MGKQTVSVYRKPVVGIISTGDEVVPINETPAIGKIRDINSYTLSGQVAEAGGAAIPLGIVRDDFDALSEKCRNGIDQSDMVLVSGGSSVGMRDFTIEILSAIPEAEILAHGISILSFHNLNRLRRSIHSMGDKTMRLRDMKKCSTATAYIQQPFALFRMLAGT